jgi:hypothetical protein
MVAGKGETSVSWRRIPEDRRFGTWHPQWPARQQNFRNVCFGCLLANDVNENKEADSSKTNGAAFFYEP